MPGPAEPGGEAGTGAGEEGDGEVAGIDGMLGDGELADDPVAGAGAVLDVNNAVFSHHRWHIP